MRTYLTKAWALATVAVMVSFSPAHAGIFDWFSNKKIEYQSPLGAFVGQNIGVGSPQDISEEEPFEMQLIHQTTIVAINNPVLAKKISPASPAKSYVTVASAYSSTIDQTDSTPFITAHGTHVRDGIIATNFLPFGTIVRIPEVFGEKIFVVEDRMHTRFSDRVDIWFPTRIEALEFGLRKVKIEIVS